MAPTPLATQMLARVTDAFEAARDDEAAPAMRAYMRNQFPFLGIKTPVRVALLRTALARHEPARESRRFRRLPRAGSQGSGHPCQPIAVPTR